LLLTATAVFPVGVDVDVDVDVDVIVYQGITLPSYVVVEKTGWVDASRPIATRMHEPLPFVLNVHCSSRPPIYASGLPDAAGVRRETERVAWYPLLSSANVTAEAKKNQYSGKQKPK
jgi:hypothetical protein